MNLVLQNGKAWPNGQLRDITIQDGRILTSGVPATDRIDLDGRWVLPGLWDSHVHFDTLLALSQGISLAVARSQEEAVALLRSSWPHAGLVFAYGFRSATWPEPPQAHALDELSSIPIVALGNDLHSVWLNTAASQLFEARAAGHLVEEDAFRVEHQVIATIARSPVAFRSATELAAAKGVVGITDYEMSWTIDRWGKRFDDGFADLRVEVGIRDDLLDEAIAAGLHTGKRLGSLLSVGAMKVISDGSLGSKTAWCHEPYVDDPSTRGQTNIDPAALAELLTRAKEAGFDAAVHAIGDRAMSSALAAFAASGAGGSIEHAQLVRPDQIERLAALGLIASVQPAHLLDDRSTADVAWSDRTEHVFPLASLLRAGVKVRLGSDAPVAPLDPWLAISAAVERKAGTDSPWHPEQRISVHEAVAASVRTTLAPGQPADLVVLDEDLSSSSLAQMPVAATIVDGRFTFSAL